MSYFKEGDEGEKKKSKSYKESIDEPEKDQ